ncbi:MAG: hypothetical protein ACT4PE_11790, partial [Candidatus Eiseniibacteriota bacterium]
MASPRPSPWVGVAAVLVLQALCISPVRGATVTWINASGGAWNSPGNWDTGVPGAADSALITLDGTYTVTLDVNATVASLTLGGASGTQTLSASGRTLTLGGASSVSANGALTMSSSTVSGTGPLTNSGTFTLTGSTVNAPLNNEALLIIQGTSAVNGTLTIGVGSTLRVQGSNVVGGGALTVASGFTNNGTLELTSVSGSSSATLTVTNGTLVNASGQTIDVLVGTGSTGRTLAAQLDNQGTLSLGAPLTISKASADHVSSGTIDVSGGDLTLTQSF